MKRECPVSPDGRHHRDNQDLCHSCGIYMPDGWVHHGTLPEFQVVMRRLPKKRLAQYHEHREPRLITISLPAMTGVTQAERRYVIFHELGHWFQTETVPLAPAEDFAHDFALYFAAPRALRAEKPVEYQSMKLYVGSQDKRIKKFAKKLLAAI